jgi:hypothetical protein
MAKTKGITRKTRALALAASVEHTTAHRPAFQFTTTGRELYALGPGATALDVRDQLDARLAQIGALVHMTMGCAGEVFRGSSDEIQESYMFAVEMMAIECKELLSLLPTTEPLQIRENSNG